MDRVGVVGGPGSGTSDTPEHRPPREGGFPGWVDRLAHLDPRTVGGSTPVGPVVSLSVGPTLDGL